MKRFSRLPTIELLEEKRLKAADSAKGDVTHESALVESIGTPTGGNSAGEQSRIAFLTAEESTDGSDTEEQNGDSNSADSDNNDSDDSESGDNNDSQTDDTNDSDSEDSDEGDSDDTNDSDSNDTSDSDSDDSNDGNSDDSDDNETDDTDDNESDDSSDDDSNDENETNLSTNLSTSGNVVQGNAKFESETEDGTTKREATVEITTGVADGQYTVTIGTGTGAFTAPITVSGGKGKLELSSDPDDDETLLPDSVTIEAGTAISINTPTPISGTFAASTSADSLKQLPGLTGGTPQSLLADSPVSPISTHSVSSQAFATATSSISADNAVDANLLDVGSAETGQSLDSWSLADFQPNHTADDTVADDSTVRDAIFEALVEGAPIWML
jgi:hypothetical protein